jgi:hypothetical protein
MTVSAHDLRESPSDVLVARGEQKLVLAALRRIPIECTDDLLTSACVG